MWINIFGFPTCTEPIFGSEFKINDAMQPRIGMCTFWPLLRNRGPVLTPFWREDATTFVSHL